jgi:CheY-like chemotaxis protein
MFARSREAGRRRRHVVIAHSDPAYSTGVARAFRRYGWGVAHAADGPEARQLATSLAADLVVLQADLPAESGWLTCAKLSADRGRPSVVLVAEGPVGCDEPFAEFAGATRLVSRHQGAGPLLEEAGLAVPMAKVV